MIPNEETCEEEDVSEDERGTSDTNSIPRPVLSDTVINPEVKLANQLCGQCHSYFESCDWREVPIDENGRFVVSSSHHSGQTSSVMVHMEEVVFDVS